MASSLDHLHLSFPGCSGRYLNNIYRTSNVTFPFVSELHLSTCCTGHKENSLLGLTSERFPSVRTLNIDVRDSDCVHQNGPALPIILSQAWPNITQLRLAGNIKQDYITYLATALPNLITFNYVSDVDSYNLADLLPKLKFLQVLALRDCYSKPYIGQSSTITMPSIVMNRLRSIKLRNVTLTVDMVRFIFTYCPNLVELEIWDCRVSKDVVEHTNEISKNVKSPVRRLRLKGYFQEHLDLWVEFVSKFKNIK
ncbi:hypothetical protein GQ42DRAFT_162290, partial [Ramicandelaber brevisporus]